MGRLDGAPADGDEFGSPVTTDYGAREFTGEVDWVEIELGPGGRAAPRCAAAGDGS